jgi:hypothetical protein
MTAPVVRLYCAFERDHQRPCPVCRSATQLLNGPETAPTHTGHLALAVAVDVAHARQLYAERGLHLFDSEIRDLPRDERAQLDAWATTTDALPEAFASRAHVASSGPLIGCTRCAIALDDAPSLYAPGTYVGLDCEGSSGGDR